MALAEVGGVDGPGRGLPADLVAGRPDGAEVQPTVGQDRWPTVRRLTRASMTRTPSSLPSDSRAALCRDELRDVADAPPQLPEFVLCVVVHARTVAESGRLDARRTTTTVQQSRLPRGYHGRQRGRQRAGDRSGSSHGQDEREAVQQQRHPDLCRRRSCRRRAFLPARARAGCRPRLGAAFASLAHGRP